MKKILRFVNFGGGALYGGSEDKKVRIYAIICGQSSKKNKYIPLLGKVRMGFDEYSPHLSREIKPSLNREGLEGFQLCCFLKRLLPTPNPFLIREGESNSPKRTYRLNVLPSPKCAFTLAEVLITLGIIGIVAAMTMPSLINKTQNKQLETAFKKAYSVHSQALLYTKQSLGVENLKTAFATFDAAAGVYPLAREFYNEYYKYLKIDGTCVYSKSVRNYNNTQDASIDRGTAYPSRQLPDGSCSGTFINAASINITVDVNGAKKGPNRLGHDIFVFNVDAKDSLVPVKKTKDYSEQELTDIENWYIQDGLSEEAINAAISQMGNPCSKNSNQKGNGLGCSWYALNDINPDDETKGYWESLP